MNPVPVLTRRARRTTLAAVATASAVLAAGLASAGAAVSAGQSTPTTSLSTVGTTPAANEANRPACDAYTSLNAQFGGQPDLPTVKALAAQLGAEKDKTGVAAELTVMLAAVDAAATGDMSKFESAEFSMAKGTVDPWMYEHCPFAHRIEIQAVEYGFVGLPGELPAGPIGMLLVNQGAQVHEIVIARKKEGTTETWEQLTAMSQDAAMHKVDVVGQAFTPLTGSKGLVTANLTPGDYAAICFIPEGMTMSTDGRMTHSSGPPHFAKGMIATFTVRS